MLLGLHRGDNRESWSVRGPWLLPTVRVYTHLRSRSWYDNTQVCTWPIWLASRYVYTLSDISTHNNCSCSYDNCDRHNNCTQPISDLTVISWLGHVSLGPRRACLLLRHASYSNPTFTSGRSSKDMQEERSLKSKQAGVYRGVGCAHPITPLLDVRILPVNWAYLHIFPMNTRKWDMQSHQGSSFTM